VIFLSAAQRLVVSELVAEKGERAMEEAWHGEHALFRLWYVLTVSLFSSLLTPIETRQATRRTRQFSVFLLVGRDERLGLRPLAIYAKDETTPLFLFASPIDPP